MYWWLKTIFVSQPKFCGKEKGDKIFFFGKLEISLRKTNEKATTQDKACYNTSLGNQRQQEGPTP